VAALESAGDGGSNGGKINVWRCVLRALETSVETGVIGVPEPSQRGRDARGGGDAGGVAVAGWQRWKAQETAVRMVVKSLPTGVY
jgi:hypothetical protein